MSTTQTDTSAVRYDQDADGIVTLTLDDPTASANTMNELYVESMAAAVDRLYDEADVRHRRRRGQREEDLLRRGEPQRDGQGRPRRRPGRLRARRAGQGLAAPARDLPQAGRGRDQRRRARRRLRDRPGLQPPGRGRRQLRGRAPRGQPRPAPRRWRRHPHHPAARHPERPDGRAAPGQHLQARGGQGEGARRRARRHPGRAGPGRQGLDQGQPGRRTEPVGRPRLQDARRLAEDAGHGRLPAGVPRAAAQAAQGRGLPGAEGDPVGRRRGCPGRLRHRDAGSSRAT